MPPPASLRVPTSRQDALRILADTREPLGGSEFVLVAEYVTNEELLDQRRKTNPSIILNTMTTTLDNARDQHAVDHNQMPGTYRYDFKHRRCNNLEAALGRDHPSVRGLRQSTDRATKGDEWISAGLSLNELAALRGNHTQPSPDALYGRLWEYHPDLNSQAENIRIAFNYQNLSSVYHLLCHVKRLGPVISRIMAASPPNAQPNAQPIPRNTTARRTTVRKRVKLTPVAGPLGGHDYTLHTFGAPAIASTGPSPLFASSPVLLSGATVPLPPGFLWPIPSAVTRIATSSTPSSLPSASQNSTQIPRGRPNLIDVAYGHAAGFDVVSWSPPMQGPVTYVTSIAALYIGLATGKNVRIIETRSESEMEQLRLHAGDTMYR